MVKSVASTAISTNRYCRAREARKKFGGDGHEGEPEMELYRDPVVGEAVVTFSDCNRPKMLRSSQSR